MKNILIVFFIVFFVLLIIVFPFKTRMMGHINLLELKCFYSIKTWIIKLLCGKIEYDDAQLVFSNEKALLTKSYNTDFVKETTKKILERLDVKKIELFFTGGFEENSFSSAIMCGSISAFVESFYGYLSLKYENVKMYKDIEPTFEDNNLELTFDIVVSISFFKLILSLVLAKKYLSKKLKEESV